MNVVQDFLAEAQRASFAYFTWILNFRKIKGISVVLKNKANKETPGPFDSFSVAHCLPETAFTFFTCS